jgi:hypothetical protein
MKPKLKQSSKKLIFYTLIVIYLIALIGLIIALNNLDYLAGFQRPSNIQWVEGRQEYNGTLNVAQLRIEFNKNDLQPKDDNGNLAIISFKPFCGTPGSTEANASRKIVDYGSVSWTENGGVEVYIQTTWIPINESDENLKSTTRCALDKVKDIMQHNLGMNLTNEKIEQKKLGREAWQDYDQAANAVFVLIAVAVISIILAAVIHSKKN